MTSARHPKRDDGSIGARELLEHELVVAAHLLGLAMRGSVRSTIAPGK
jgi:hypothetical protein